MFLAGALMPGMSGFELAHRAKQLRPDLAITDTSAYTHDLPRQEHGIACGPLIKKLWAIGKLREHVAPVGKAHASRHVSR
jgi:CheY-like chemotaxis protein